MLHGLLLVYRERKNYESIKWGRGHCERNIFRGKHVNLQRFVYSWKGVLGTVDRRPGKCRGEAAVSDRYRMEYCSSSED